MSYLVTNQQQPPLNLLLKNWIPDIVRLPPSCSNSKHFLFRLLFLTGVVSTVRAQIDDFSCPDEFEGFYPHLYRWVGKRWVLYVFSVCQVNTHLVKHFLVVTCSCQCSDIPENCHGASWGPNKYPLLLLPTLLNPLWHISHSYILNFENICMRCLDAPYSDSHTSKLFVN